MKRIAIAIAFLFAGLSFAQTDNTVYVKNFSGNDVGAKVAAAQQTCTTNLNIICILVLDPSLAGWASGTMPTLYANVQIADYRVRGPATAIPGLSSDGALGIKIVGNASAGNYTLGPLSWQYYVAEGDSTSAGYLQPSPSTQSWPAQLSNLPFFLNRATFLNASISGSTWESMTGRYTSAVQPYKPNGTSILKSFLSVLIGRNNLSESLTTIESGITAYVNQAKTDGFTTILATVLPSTTVTVPPLSAPTCSVTNIASNSGTSQTTFTCANTFSAGQYVFVNGISPSPTLSTTACTATQFSVSSGIVTVTCPNSLAVGQAVYLQSFTGAGSELNTYWVFVSTENGSQFTFSAALANIGNTATTGTVTLSTGAGINLNNNVFPVVSATGSSFVSSLYGGGNYSAANTATASYTPAKGWDPIQPGQEPTLEVLNDWIRHYPICNTLQSTGCIDYMVDFAQLMRNPNNIGVDTYDGTHETPGFSFIMANIVNQTLIKGGAVLPAQPLSSGVSPTFNGIVSAAGGFASVSSTPDSLAGGGPAFTGPYLYGYEGTSASWLDSYNASTGYGWPVIHRALTYQFNCGQVWSGGGTSCLNITGDGGLSTGLVNVPQNFSIGASQGANGFKGTAGTKLATAASAAFTNGDALCSNATGDIADCGGAPLQLASTNSFSAATPIVYTQSATFTIGATAQVGTGASAPSCITTCSALSGIVGFTTGTGTLNAGQVLQINLPTRTVKYACFLGAVDSTAATPILTVQNPANYGFNLAAWLTGALTPSHQYYFNYVCP